MKCLICLKEFFNLKSLSVHIRIHNITVKEYYDKFLKKENEGKCLFCGKDTKFYYLSSGYNDYCGAICASTATTDKRETTCLKNWGFKNPRSHPFIDDQIKNTCLLKYGEISNLKSQITKEKIKKTCLEKFGVENPQQSEEVKEKKKQTCLDKYGVDSWSKTNQGKQLFRIIRSKILKNSNNAPFSGILELDFLNTLKFNFPFLKIEDQKSCIGYFLDIYLPDYNIVIEFDEEYHNLQYMKEKDKKRQNEIENFLKCSFIRIRKLDFLKNPRNIINQLEVLLAFNPKQLFM